MGNSNKLRPWAHSCALFSLVCSSGAPALGLGEISVDSALNERLAASIPLLSPTRDQRETVSVHVARIEDFQRVGIEWTEYMSTLRFRLVEGRDGTRVVIDSDEPAHEPYLNFVVEARWAGGRLLREYTVLLDPPKELNLLPAAAEAAPIRPAAVADAMPQAPQRPVPEIAASVPATAPAPADSAPPSAGPAPERTGNPFHYGPVRPHEQPRAIAARLHPGPGVTPEQVELALYRANPDAFVHGRLDHMVPGSMLRIPPLETIRAEPADSARAIILDMRARLLAQRTNARAARAAASGPPRHRATAGSVTRIAPTAATSAQPLQSATQASAAPAPPVLAAPAAAPAVRPAPAPPATAATVLPADAPQAAPAAAAVPPAARPSASTEPPRVSAPRPDSPIGRREWSIMLWLWSGVFMLIGLGALLLLALRNLKPGLHPGAAAAARR